MNKQSIVDLFSSYRPMDDREDAMTKDLLAFVARHDNPWSKSVQEGHLTASAWIVNADKTKVLMVEHNKLKKWLQPGGHVEDTDTDLARAALREAMEETGVSSIRLVQDTLFDVDVHEIPPFGQKIGHKHYDCRFLMIANDMDDLVCSCESTGVQWFNIMDVIGQGRPSLERMARKSVGNN